MTSKMSLMFIALILPLTLLGCSVNEEILTRTPVPSTMTQQTVTSVSPCLITKQEDPYLAPRLNMVKDTIESRGVTDPDVLRAMKCVPRHEFVQPVDMVQAYEDHPLSIGYGQTISQPYIVAWMTELIELKPGEKVLEIGTGSGYQAAVLAELGNVEIYSIEIVPEFADSAKERLTNLGYLNVHLMQGDGYFGWPEDILFDAILVTAAPDHVPGPLAAQLAEGGRMVIPIGPIGAFQTLWKFVKVQDELKAYNLGSVAFVPFTGEGVEAAPAQTPSR